MPLQRSHPELRASDAERERVAVFLRDQAAVGRLSHDELEERVAAAYRAVTVGELERLIRDLPRARPPARRRRRDPGKLLLPLGLGALAVVAAPTALFVVLAVTAAVGFAALALVFTLGLVFGPFILVALLIVAMMRRRRPPRRMRWDPHYY